MLLTLGISLYTSRVVLNVLGVQDFGIYNLVGGIVIVFSFINNAMSGGTQRFLNFEMGQNDGGRIAQVFSSSLRIHIGIIIIIIILSETVGLWFLNYMLNIPAQRLHVANIVYQFSLLSFAFGVLKTPYNAGIVAYEKMSFFAICGITEALLKLAVMFLLLKYNYDKLVLYSILTFFVTVILFFISYVFVKKNITNCHFLKKRDVKMEKEMLNFTQWGVLGHISLIGSNQGLAMILNIFTGVIANAALGIANQVNTAIFSFVANIQTAFSPQIIKTYSINDLKSHTQLVIYSSIISYYLIFLLELPIVFYTEFILRLWLGKVPEYSIGFTQIILIISLIDALSGPYWMAINATGKVKRYQIGVSLILFLNLPIAYLLLLQGLSPTLVILSKLTINLILFLYRIFTFKKGVGDKHVDFAFYKKYIRLIFVTITTVILLCMLKEFWLEKINLLNFIKFLFAFIIILLASVWFIGLDNFEKVYAKKLLFKYYNNIKKRYK